jgi:putative endopeptidase
MAWVARVAAGAALAISFSLAAAAPGGSGVDPSGIDGAVKPGDDFFAYANGAWAAKTEIPADRASVGIWTVLADRTDDRVRTLIQTAAASHPAPGSDARKVGDFYAGFLDRAAIEARGLKPLQPELKRIAAIRDRKALAAYLGSTLSADVDALNATDFYTGHVLGLWVNQSFHAPERNVPYLLQGGLGLPDREYYLADTPKMAEVRAKYLAHAAAVLKLAGYNDADVRAQKIVAFETAIAKTHAARAESEDVHKADNPWARSDFAVRAPGLDWNAFFAAAHLGHVKDFVAWHPSALTGLAALAASQPLDVWKDYLTLRLIEHDAAVLPKAFDEEHFAFYGTVLSGTTQQREIWRRAIDATNGSLGQPVGRLYVEKYFPSAAKAKIEALVAELISAYRIRIQNLAWMSPATKAKALAKLDTLKVGVGYPGKWPDYSGLKIVRGDAFGNLARAEAFATRRALNKLKHAADRGEWVMDPQEVNAVNLPLANALNFPAAILQPPFFDADADPAANYGAIGAVIGHEISHSFDDQGSEFDATGALKNWWTADDAKHFAAASARLAAQYDAYRPFPDLAVNGKQTLSENIADVAGLSAAFDAYRLSLKGAKAPVIGGLSGEQRFFLAFAQAWRTKMREESLRRQILTDGHAPAPYRADTVRNLDAWYEAFGVLPGEALFLAPAGRVQVW